MIGIARYSSTDIMHGSLFAGEQQQSRRPDMRELTLPRNGAHKSIRSCQPHVCPGDEVVLDCGCLLCIYLYKCRHNACQNCTAFIIHQILTPYLVAHGPGSHFQFLVMPPIFQCHFQSQSFAAHSFGSSLSLPSEKSTLSSLIQWASPSRRSLAN